MDSQAYYLFDQGNQIGPYEPAQIKSMWKQGALTAEAQYYSEDEWRPISELVGSSFRRLAASMKEEMNKPEVIARQKRTNRVIWISMTAFAVLFTIFLVSVIDTTSSPRGREETSAAFNIGYRDGQSAGRRDASFGKVQMGRSTAGDAARQSSAPLAPTGLSRAEYEDGWRAGYSSGYGSYTK